jgi:hypothetical protein
MSFIEDFSAGGMANSAVQANMAKQAELNEVLAEAGEPLLVVDGVVGRKTLAAEVRVAELLAASNDDTGDEGADTGGTGDEGAGDEGTGDEGAGDEGAGDEGAATGGEGLFTDQENYPGLRAQPETTDKDGKSEVWGIYKTDEGEWDWEKLDLGGNKPATRSEAQIAADARASAAALLRGENAALATGNARDTLGALFRQMFGNDPKFAPDIKLLTNQLEGLMIKGASSLEITQEIRQSDSYDKRFPGMDLRAAAGMSAISEAEYITLEDNYRNTMRMSGLSESFIDDDALYAGLIASDVSAAELQTRVSLAETAANGADPMILAQIEEFYPEMLEGNRLVEYYLDPDKAVNIFEEERKQRAAGLSVATLRSVGQGLDVGMAEALERENIQSREIQSRLGQRRGLTDRLLGEETALTASEIASGEFGLEAEQATKLRRRREERVAGFSGQSGALTTNAGIKGLGTAT